MYKVHIQKALYLEDILNSINAPDQKIHTDLHSPRHGLFANVLDKIEWYWYAKLNTKTMKILGCILGLLSLIILFSECTLTIEGSLDEQIFGFYHSVLTGTYAQAMV